VAIRGERFDGHDFIEEALRKGAAGVMIQNSPRDRPVSRAPFWISVDDTLSALQETAKGYRRKFPIPLVGVTGSNGKSTTKEMIGAILRERFPVLISEGNLNNHIGVPLTLFGLRVQHRAAVLEMGISAPGELRTLCDLSGPTVGVITNIGPAHLEGFKTVERVAEAKSEILDYLGRDGQAVLNADDPFFEMFRKRFPGKVTTFGVQTRSDVTARDFRKGMEAGQPGTLRFTLQCAAGEGEITLSAVGIHHIYNALSAVAVGLLWGLTFEELREGLKKWTPLPLRMAFHRIGEMDILNDSYNANPRSMAAALEVLADYRERGNAIAVLGDMLELGDQAPPAHLELGRRVGALGIHGLVVMGKFASWVAQGAMDAGMGRERIRICGDHAQALEMIRGLCVGRTVLLIKGSRGMRMEKIVEGLQAEG
jgi:UDP-N-acetylmuramoyl-tripeptide--D-alanyl-D-alanine ligase